MLVIVLNVLFTSVPFCCRSSPLNWLTLSFSRPEVQWTNGQMVSAAAMANWPPCLPFRLLHELQTDISAAVVAAAAPVRGNHIYKCTCTQAHICTQFSFSSAQSSPERKWVSQSVGLCFHFSAACIKSAVDCSQLVLGRATGHLYH